MKLTKMPTIELPDFFNSFSPRLAPKSIRNMLAAQGRDYDATFVQKQFSAAWKGGRHQLQVEDLV